MLNFSWVWNLRRIVAEKMFFLALRIHHTQTLASAEWEYRQFGYYVYTVKQIGNIEYIRNPNSGEWRRVGK